jgi:addiction module HigA family antidote
MTDEKIKPIHPGKYFKDNKLPEGLTIKKAAEMMGVGRPALSNFLNGKASLSTEMATRLEKTFGVDKKELLDLQRDYTEFTKKETEKQIVVRTYATSFLDIRASNIEAWAEQIQTRELLPALLRRLVNSTRSDISDCDFPAYDNSQRPGWDGYTTANNSTPWVPSGNSGWEFGCNKNVNAKANSDYSTRTKNIPVEERKNTTFIFVTPRSWSKKDEWIKLKNEEKEWKQVRAYDANDLEQWLEQSVSGQVWLADKIGIPHEGCLTLDDYWRFWSETATPKMSEKFFDSAVAAHSETLKTWCQSKAEKPLLISASSKEEALAFIACAFSSIEELHPLSEKAVLVSTADAVKKMATTAAEFIAVAHTESAELELVLTFKDRHSIVIVEKNIVDMEPDINVELPSYESFRDALEEMGFDDAQKEVHSSSSGRSPTILRRQLATTPALKKPKWAGDSVNIELMIPIVLAGTWKSSQNGDKEILSQLADVHYDEIEKNVALLTNIDDAPIWSEGRHRGVVSKLDCFYAISDLITESDLEKFFFVAEYVLSEDDPALDLDKDKRWAANIYDKVRDHSGVIRKSICETLVILSIYGDALIGKRLDVTVENDVNVLIRKLLHDKSARVWQSQQADLPYYAEAAPDVFLDIIEHELTSDLPAFSSLFESVDGGMFSRCERTGMLWALELLAWSPSRLSRVVRILAQLCKYKLEDNWANKPISSLNDILLSWMPHTTAPLKQRCEVLEMLCKEYEGIGWDICMKQLKPTHSSTSGTYRPHWRNDASGAGQVVTHKDRFDFTKKCQELVLSWPTYTKNTLADLVDCLVKMDDKSRNKVSQEISTWVESASPEDIAELREHVRTNTMTRRARVRKEDRASYYADGKKLYDSLEPRDLLLRHQWLFAKQWVEYSPEDLEADDLNFEQRDAELSKLRILALNEIIESYGQDGLIALCLKGDAGFIIGFHLARDILTIAEQKEFVLKCILIESNKEDSHRIDRCLSGVLHQIDDVEIVTFMQEMISLMETDDLNDDIKVRFFINAPFTKMSWDCIESQNKIIQKTYWREVYPSWHDQSSEDLNFIVDELIAVNRPRAAIDLVWLKPDRVNSSNLIRLLMTLGTSKFELEKGQKIAHYHIEKLLEILNQRDDIDRMELVQLEFMYVQILTPSSEYGIPNLSKEIAESPLMFVQMIALCFKRKAQGRDPEEWQLPTELANKKSVSENAYSTLESINIIPGMQEDGTIDIVQLRDWIFSVRALAEEHGRAVMADQKIGRILSESSDGKDGIWPREEVRQVFEEVASREISIGMEIGLRNARGASFRAANGEAERELANKYHRFADEVMNKTPFVGRMLASIAKSYEYDAKMWDSDGRVQKRLQR